ncbi:NDP-hexose 2,3-dehydratase family protein [Streptomyces acidiscabies]|uniref:NDP-hexose 2,3-dehydratase n=1 Tax=Streptomyces acidiscabies TaxID=42234 RepID=A0A0L0JMC6_9ACTN|nr:NDP-hexose 2,3-dehydratase family protein [Streptomyces acidiscabies]KND26555.1 NDP-hexose 2,3-dehydratase [Streptomyces acidiscabies]
MRAGRGFTVTSRTPATEADHGLSAWLRAQQDAHHFATRRIDFGDLSAWHFEEDGGNLAHDSGRFFRVEGLDVTTDHSVHASWAQPIINQPEIGLLGILVKTIDGVAHCLLQAKMEPGNINTIQLSPTVQATRSNYTRVHGGKHTPYLEYFTGPRRVLADSIQSEQCSWFLCKGNRNVVVEVTGDVPVLENFRWVTTDQLHGLLRQDNTVNMDTRTVLSCVPFALPEGARLAEESDDYRRTLLSSLTGDEQSLHTLDDILGWITEAKARRLFVRRTTALGSLGQWRRFPDRIAHEEGRYFEIVAMDVTAGSREVSHWTQPMFAPVGQGRVAFVVRSIKGVLHVLMQARLAAGSRDAVELAPTVQCTPANLVGLPETARPRFLDLVQGADPRSVRYDAVQSEEGGRFHHAQTRHQIIDVGDDFPLDVPEEFRWLTVRQLTELLRHSNYLNVEARSLLAMLHTTW